MNTTAINKQQLLMKLPSSKGLNKKISPIHPFATFHWKRSKGKLWKTNYKETCDFHINFYRKRESKEKLRISLEIFLSNKEGAFYAFATHTQTKVLISLQNDANWSFPYCLKIVSLSWNGSEWCFWMIENSVGKLNFNPALEFNNKR